MTRSNWFANVLAIIVATTGVGCGEVSGTFVRLTPTPRVFAAPSESPSATEAHPTEATVVGGTPSLDETAIRVTGVKLPTPTDIDAANEHDAASALRAFLQALHFRKYAEAEQLYGGSYEVLLGFIPTTVSQDHVLVWQRICDEYYLQCLLPKDVTLVDDTDTSFEFLVTYYNPDGSIFTLGPCCGGNATDNPPITEFPVSVIVSEGRYFVLGTPPYVP